jgi:two-component system sensor histidine kinase RegB
MAAADLRQVVAWHRPLQWATCIALWSTFAASLLPELQLPLREIAASGFVAAMLRTAVLRAGRGGSPPRWLATLGIGADVVLLTGLLDITGGPFNPFVVIYAVGVWLAIMLSTPAGIAVGLTAGVSFGWLLLDHLRAGLAEHHRLNDFPTHLFTMWFAGSCVADLVAHYVLRARVAFAAQQQQLDAARDRAARSERLASLTTLAAGAAHELSTPLATIAVVTTELERAARQIPAAGLGDDIKLIQDAVQRCRAILDGMSGRAAGDGLARAPMSAAAIAELACAALPADRRTRLRLDLAQAPHDAIDGGVEVSRALSSLLKNAFDASGDVPVSLHVRAYDAGVRFTVHDRGHGMSDDVRQRAGEPFFTTKAPGEGLGLGLFLARTIAEQFGGSLRFDSTDGTVAILDIPAPAAS